LLTTTGRGVRYGLGNPPSRVVLAWPRVSEFSEPSDFVGWTVRSEPNKVYWASPSNQIPQFLSPQNGVPNFFLNVLPDAEWELDAEGSPAPDEDEWWDDWPQFAARDLICERSTAVRAASRLPSDCSRRDT